MSGVMDEIDKAHMFGHIGVGEGGMFSNRESPYIIAEIGSNWSTLGEAIGSIGIAAGCGVDAVKFQLFSHKDLYGFDGPGGGIEPDWLPQLKEKADACKVDFLCSAFSVEGVELVDKYVHVHKIAASEAAWPQLIDMVRDTGKPAIVTAGSLSVNEIMAVVAQFCFGDRICVYYMVSLTILVSTIIYFSSMTSSNSKPLLGLVIIAQTIFILRYRHITISGPRLSKNTSNLLTGTSLIRAFRSTKRGSRY
jgi:sialic acid synthase SpsE